MSGAEERTLTLGGHGEQFRHTALLYSGEDEFLAGTAAFVREGLAADEPVMVALGVPRIEALKAELGPPADRVLFTDMAEMGANPARIIPAWHDFVENRPTPHGGLRGIGEPIWAERSQAELVECQRHESLLNLVFDGTPGFQLLCPYDVDALPAEVLEEALRSHPLILAGGVTKASHDTRTLVEVGAPFADPLPDPPPQADSRVFAENDLAAVRRFVARCAADAGMGARTAGELVLATHEVATNSVLHGGGKGVVRIWQEGETLLCEVLDEGHIDSPLAGRQRPAPGEAGGYGLWLSNQLCDLVQVRSFPEGSVVRLHKRRER